MNTDDKRSNHSDWPFHVLAVFVLLYSLFMGFAGKDVTMGIAAFLSLAFFFFGMMDRFSSFKASATGMEAHLRDVVREADRTLEYTKKLAVMLAKMQVSMLMRVNRMGGYKQAEKEKAWDDIMKVLEAMGVPEQERKEAMTDVRRFTKFDLYREAVTPGHRYKENIPAAFRQEWQGLAARPVDNLPSPDELERFFKRAEVWGDVEKEAVEDYRYYCQNERLRRGLPDDDRPEPYSV